ncbi:MAG: hypothetical protein LQ348_006658 [Seirophora lacunosa]|nr:MAG: hypothetical protein LQ348_006658 [Seirophora lacunosa]
MFSRVISTLILLLVIPNNAAVLNPHDGTLTNTPAPLIDIPFPSSNDVQVQCGGRQFGTGLQYRSCLDAFSSFPFGGSDDPMDVGRRETGMYDQNLPWKWVSSDGRCVLDIVMKGPAAYETTTGREIARAAWKLINECVRDQQGQGGVVQGIGRSGALGIFIRSYDPRSVECGSVVAPGWNPTDCNALMDTIFADVAPPKTWGPRHQPGVDNGLPYVFFTPVWGAYGQPVRDTMTYYDMWTAGVMLAGMCARPGKAGKFELLGRERKLWVLLDDKAERGPGLESAVATEGLISGIEAG